MKLDSKRTITLEDLLRLKRAERPAPEFWATFDRELRAKQLAALVEKRPWWQRLPGTVLRMPKYRVALGAVAVACLTVFSARNFRSTPAIGAPNIPEVIATSPSSENAIRGSAPAAETEINSSALGALAATQLEPVSIARSTEPVVMAESDAPRSANAVAPVSVEPSASAVDSPAARHIAANLARVQSSDVIGTKGLLAVANIEPRALPTRVAVEPLHQMTPPDETRRARYFTAMVSTTALDHSAHTAERAANRIAEEQLYDRVRRLDARGDRLKWKL